MATAEQGYLTIAAGRVEYLEMAVDLVLSMREFDTRPVALAADSRLADDARTRFRGIFSSVHLIDPEFLHHRALKFCAARVTPFEETVYIDVDCLILANPEPLWSGASPAPITMMGDILTSEQDRWHQSYSTRELMHRFGLTAYLKTNGGILHFRREGAAELLEECHRCYNEEVLGELWDRRYPPIGLGDEFAFAITGGRRGFGTYPAPVPTYWTHEVKALKLNQEQPRKAVLHFIAPVPTAALELLMQDVARRRRHASLPPLDSIPYWRRKAQGPGWFRRVKRWIHNHGGRQIRTVSRK